MGYSIDGGFGEYAVAYGRYVVRVPDGVDPFDAAPLTCAGVTTYKAVKVAGTRSSDLVAVFGIGGARDPPEEHAGGARGPGLAGCPPPPKDGRPGAEHTAQNRSTQHMSVRS